MRDPWHATLIRLLRRVTQLHGECIACFGYGTDVDDLASGGACRADEAPSNLDGQMLITKRDLNQCDGLLVDDVVWYVSEVIGQMPRFRDSFTKGSNIRQTGLPRQSYHSGVDDLSFFPFRDQWPGILCPGLRSRRRTKFKSRCDAC
jgi:hypothetical protein